MTPLGAACVGMGCGTTAASALAHTTAQMQANLPVNPFVIPQESRAPGDLEALPEAAALALFVHTWLGRLSNAPSLVVRDRKR
jgi:hypothetical protein